MKEKIRHCLHLKKFYGDQQIEGQKLQLYLYLYVLIYTSIDQYICYIYIEQTWVIRIEGARDIRSFSQPSLCPSLVNPYSLLPPQEQNSCTVHQLNPATATKGRTLHQTLHHQPRLHYLHHHHQQAILYASGDLHCFFISPSTFQVQFFFSLV